MIFVPFALLAACSDASSPPVSGQTAGTGVLTLGGRTIDLQVSGCERDGEDYFSLSAIAPDETLWEVSVEHTRTDDAGINDSIEIRTVSPQSGELAVLEATSQGEPLFAADSQGVNAPSTTFTGDFVTPDAGSTPIREQGSIEASCPEEP